MKDVEFVGTSLDDLRQFPLSARRAMGHQIDRIQNGLDPADWKPMSGIGVGVREIRVRDQTGAWRVIYITRLPEAVYVLHCFQKKTQKTPKFEIELAVARLGELMTRRARRSK
ncbi:MAG: type II toxin-antitoxin system RelE/ParE family toxin [Ramlibacter sp.]|nr:type II toxin-antitoxin system RelE/ParE family toxin [Ramlibacter sp.]